MGKLGLVLSGGGAKGAYEIGAYRALRKLGKHPDIVTGTSIGSVNGVLIVQGDLAKAVKMWKSMSFKTVYDENTFQVCDNPAIAEVYAQYVKSFIAEGGMDVTKLTAIFDKMFDSRKFFGSNIDFGLVTYNLTKNAPVFVTKKDLTPETVKDYVIASSSCYPAFKPHKIGGDTFIDGGYYDNLPINLAVDMGADEIIAIDLRAVGFKKDPKKDVIVTTITPRNKIVSFLVFDKARSKEALHFGYNDTMKTFGKLDGNKFTFKKANLVKNYNKYGENFETKLHNIFDNTDVSFIDSISAIIYNIKTYNKGLLSKLSETMAIDKDIIANKIKNKDFKKLLDSKQIVSFFYEAIAQDNCASVFKYLPIFSDEFLIALYIYTIIGNRSTF